MGGAPAVAEDGDGDDPAVDAVADVSFGPKCGTRAPAASAPTSIIGTVNDRGLTFDSGLSAMTLFVLQSPGRDTQTRTP